MVRGQICSYVNPQRLLLFYAHFYQLKIIELPAPPTPQIHVMFVLFCCLKISVKKGRIFYARK